MTELIIEIDCGKPCRKCGASGAEEKTGLCTKCIGKEIVKTIKQEKKK